MALSEEKARQLEQIAPDGTTAKQAPPAEQAKAETKETTPPKEQTPEEKKAFTAFMSKWLGPEVVEEKQPAKEGESQEKSQEKTKGETEKPASEETPPEKKPAKPKAPKQPPLDTKQLIEATAQGVAKAMREQTTQPVGETKPVAPSNDGYYQRLPDAEKRKVDSLRVMEELNPDKAEYKGIADRYAKATAEAIEYARKWEKDHPGETFDEQSAEHEEFFNTHNVDWEDDDFDDARAEARSRAKVTQVEQSLRSEIDELKRGKRLEQEAPIVDKHQAASAKAFFEAVDPKLAKVFKEDGTIDKEFLANLQKEDPVLAGIAVGHFAPNIVEPLSGELYRLCNGLSKFDPKRNDHRAISEFASKCEQDMLQLPAEQQVNEKGQTFLTSADYMSLPVSERGKHWVLGASELSTLLAADAAAHAKKMIAVEREKYQEWAKSMGYEVAGKAQNGSGKETEKTQEQQARKPDSPSVTSTPKVAGAGDQNGAGSQNPQTAFLNKFLGQR